MSFTIKDWRNATTHEGGGDTSTPISAVAIEDAETRLSDHTELHGPAESVKDAAYGAVGDGATDDTAAFEATRDGAGVGGHIYVPPGTYLISGLLLTVAGQFWEFAPGAILKIPNASTSGAIVELRAESIVLDGGEFNGNAANTTGAGSDVAIHMRASHCQVRNAYLHDARGYGIVGGTSASGAATEVSHMVVSNCRVIDVWNTGIFINVFGISTPTYGHQIRNCYVDNSAVAVGSILGGGPAMRGPDATANQPTGCLIDGCYYKGRTDATADVEGMGLTNIRKSTISNCYSAQASLESFILTGSYLTLTNSVAFGSDPWGVEINQASPSTISNCQIDGNAVSVQGIEINGAQDVLIEGNTITNLIDSASSFGIQIDDTTTNPQRVSILANEIRAFKKGIYTNTDDLLDVLIEGNLIAASVGGQANRTGIQLQTTTAGSQRWVVRGNALLDWDYRGVWLINAGISIAETVVRDNDYIDCGTTLIESTGTTDNTCVIVDTTHTGTVASVAGTITLPFHEVITLTGTNAVTNITASHPGRRVTLINTSTASLADGGNLKLAGGGPNSADDSISLVCDGTDWFETSRSSN